MSWILTYETIVNKYCCLLNISILIVDNIIMILDYEAEWRNNLNIITIWLQFQIRRENNIVQISHTLSAITQLYELCDKSSVSPVKFIIYKFRPSRI